ncbi:MAG TPA: phosphopantothenoylcysteine decarboxylase, partial [Bacteroidales bacterium]|nr:phosphopantothenoylcysteine decarboxylase [Bacteroidales bacterium]
NLETTHSAIKKIDVVSASEMYQACKEHFFECDGAVLSAAVADYTLEKPFNQKVKDKSKRLDLHLSPTVDIAASLGKIKRKNQVLVGFALETHDELNNAQEKLQKKNFDFIVLNSLNTEGAGFHHDTNQVTIIHRDNIIRKFELKQKKDVASDIINDIISIIQK